jgi:hypothetical protein
MSTMEICAETERAGEVMRVEGQVRDRDARGDATTGRDDGNERDETRSSFRRDAVVRRVRNLARRRTFRGLVNDVGGSGWTPCDAGRARDEDAARSRSIASSSPPRITL